MKTYIVLAAFSSVLIASPAFAQVSSIEEAQRQGPAITPTADVKSPEGGSTTTSVLVGPISFTEGQARSRLTYHGYSSLAELRKDDQSVWHATAIKDGKPVTVALDFQGNLTNNHPAWR